ncbi:hypothetical protein NEOLEDRAFT_1183993 [Neolentinus lepideus HHB14362 ss-1]|uniref:Uncharacterized protein n=1 Tax=Neolentinus lepideus HHB14362 ss-1 TaxID=1314782 RepID=A0A165MU17_9AGAM|nr:hypothetical protein NEOLEDRAFT_1183993 [Neolentinus lepideus HHB14362 ss-1]
MSTSSACWDIYARQLANLRHGHALWEPDARHPNVLMDIGDVGFLREGVFIRLFNALLPANHPSHELYSVPDDFNPLSLYGPVASPPKSPLPSETYLSKSVRALSADLKISGFTNETYGFDINLHDFVFVTGCDKATWWAMSAFTRNYTKFVGAAGGSIPGVISASFSPEGGWTTDAGVHRHQGPERRMLQSARGLADSQPSSASHVGDERSDQTVFIRGFRAKERCFRPVKIRAAAAEPNGPDFYQQHDKEENRSALLVANSSSSSSFLDCEDGVEIERIQDEGKTIFSKYVLRSQPFVSSLTFAKHPTVDIAIAHDNDLLDLTADAEVDDARSILSSTRSSLTVDIETGR